MYHSSSPSEGSVSITEGATPKFPLIWWFSSRKSLKFPPSLNSVERDIAGTSPPCPVVLLESVILPESP